MHDQHIRQFLKEVLFFRMGKKKRNPRHKRLPDKDVSKKESQESAAKFSNPTSQGTHSDFLQSSVSQETLKKPIKDTKLFELPVQKMYSNIQNLRQEQDLKLQDNLKENHSNNSFQLRMNLKKTANNQPLNFQIQHLQMLSVVFHKDQFQKLGK